MPDTSLVIALSAASVAVALTWQTIQTVRQESSSPARLIAELRLAQVAGLVLALVAGGFVGLASSAPAQPGAGLDVVLALGFAAAGLAALTREPREALTVMAAAFLLHALLDVAHRPGGLIDGAVPYWYVIGCAGFNAYLALVCYWPVIRR